MDKTPTRNDDDILRNKNEERVRKTLETYRWPDGKIRCPACGSWRPIYAQSRGGVGGYYRCPALHSVDGKSGPGKPLVFTVRTYTILARSHVALEKWLYCLDLLAKQPVSAVELATRIQITRKTAAAMLKHTDRLRYGTTYHPEHNEFLLRLMADCVKGKCELFPLSLVKR